VKVIVGAPVCGRDWILPQWFECLKAQTRPPDEYVFVVKEIDGDRSRQLLHKHGPLPPKLSYAIDRTPYVPRMERNKIGAQYVYTDFAVRRNRLLQMVLKREPGVFISLDTDILLEDPTAIERLLAMLDRAPVASLVTFLHPLGRESECYNAGHWQGGDPGSPTRAWRRVTPQDAQGTIEIDIPMAVVAMRREVLDTCRYHYHECGEDLGFAQNLNQHGYRCLYDTDLHARHVWSKEDL
jgi:hypothetical protein